MVAEYDRRRRMFVDGLNDIGLPTVEPRGAFYAFPRISATGLTSEKFSERLLFEQHVAFVPGGAFGPSGEGHVRACSRPARTSSRRRSSASAASSSAPAQRLTPRADRARRS